MHDVKKPGAQGIVRFLYNNNPFYLISAAVILYGFRVSFEEASFAANPWILASLFTGYTILLAVTAWVIVRFGKVWDDARSIFMVLLLLFMALSGSIDGLFMSNPTTAISLAGAGFLFAVTITELLTWSLGIRFRALFRLPLYAMLATSFFYPYLFKIHETQWPELDSRFIILLFPFVVSLTMLSLIPAIRRTKRYAVRNGTPWRWPLYPYSVFVLAVVGLIFRAIMLGLSFDPSEANGILGTWIFVPVFLSITWLLFEIGTVERDKDLQFLSMMLMPLSMALAVAWPLWSNTTFYDQISTDVGSPVWLTLLAVGGMYVVAWLKNAQHSETFLALALLAAALLQPNGALASDLASVQVWPCLILAVGCVASWERIRQSHRWFWACCFLSIPFTTMLMPRLVAFVQPHASMVGIETPTAINFIMLCSCVIACIFRDQFAKQVKVILSMVLPSAALMAAGASLFRSDQIVFAAAYCVLLAATGLIVFVLAKSRIHLSAALISMGASLVAVAPLLELNVGDQNFRLARFMAVGLVCFLIGLLVSAIKAGWTSKANDGIEMLTLEFRDAFPSYQETVAAERVSG